MRIDFSFLNHVTPLLKNKFIPELTNQQKRICLIASIAFASIAFAFLAGCYIGYFFFKKDKSEDVDDSQLVKPIDLDDSQLDEPIKITFLDGTVAEGEFTHGRLHGHGKKTLPNGTEEKGEFRNGQLNGNGTKTLPRGGVEEGLFVNGKLLKGKRTASFRIEEGEFDLEYGGLDGKGKEEVHRSLKKIIRKEGLFVRGFLRSGSQILPDGTREEGSFVASQLDGPGKRTWATGEEEEGEFQNGQLIKGKKIDVGGNVQEGKFKNDEIWTGKGKRSFTDWVYEGEFKNGKLHGKGQATYSDGTVKVGQFENGVFID